MKPSNDVSHDFVACVLFDGCSEPTCISYIPPLGAQCGTLIRSEAGYRPTNAGTGQ
jgi:hypothetical protein